MTARSSRAERVRFLFQFLASMFALAMATLPAHADREAFAWPGWHTPPEHVRFVDSRLRGTDLDLWIDGFGPRAPQDPLAFLRATPTFESAAGPGWAPVPPPARWAHTMVYDSIRDRLLMFGGQGYSGYSNEVWALNLSGIPQWSLVQTGGTAPSPRGFHSAVFDSLADRMLIFGGNDGTHKNDVWQLSFAGLATWSALSPTGTAPSPRQNHSAILDRARNRMVIYGGASGGAAKNDAFTFNLAGAPVWNALAPTGTAPARSTHAAVYDAVGDRMLVLCGIDDMSQPKNDVWALTFAGTPVWSTLAPTGTAPSARLGTSALYDRVRRRVVLFAGGTGIPNSNETFSLSLIGTPAWSPVAASGMPQGRQFHTAVIDPIGDRMLVFGGSSGPVLSDTWALSLTGNPTWRPFSGTRRKGHTAVLDLSRNRMLVFGGENGTQLNDVWELTLGEVPQWSRLNPDGDPPSPRALHGAIYDPKRDRMIVFGGRGATPNNEVWELSFSGELAWRPVVAVGTPPSPRLDPVVVYDSLRRRMLVFGGADAGGVFNDVWALTLSGTPTWTQIVTSGAAPSARGAAQAIYDPIRDRLVVQGGYDRSFFALSDAWRLNLDGTPAWASLAPSGTAPLPRFAAATIYDRTRDRMVISSGTDFGEFFPDIWALTLTSAVPTWSKLTQQGVTPAARSDHRAIYDENEDRLVLFGGINPLGILHDAWKLDFTSVVAAPAEPIALDARVALSSIAPNPAAGASTIAFALAVPGETGVSIHDALGRRVRTLAAGTGRLEAGPHRVVWDGRDDGGSVVPAGLYFVRVTAEGMSVSGKLVVLR